MTRYVIGPDVAIRLARDQVAMGDEHQILAPALLRSQMLPLLYQAVHHGEMTKKDAERRLNYMRGLRALVRVGLRKILDAEPETTVVGVASDGQDAIASARRLRPDVVLMDIRMPVLDGIEATRRIVRAQPATGS